MMHFLKSVILICLFILPLFAFAWNIPGHMVTGAIAYRELKKQDPKSLSRIIALLKKHPQYDQMFAPKLNQENLSEEEKDLYLFMLAARWPDDIKRTDYEPKHDNWHYINYPFTSANASVPVSEPDTANIISAYRQNMNIVKSNAADEEKAIALCWIFHLIGDIHQPLHTVKFFSNDLPAPAGDKGGNALFIKVEEGGKPLNLHSFWDGLVLGSQELREADNRAVLLKNQKVYKRKRLKGLKDRNFENWAKNESFELAKKYGYQEGNLSASTNREEAPVVPHAYVSIAKSIAEERVVLAGYRIADTLKELF